MVVLFNVKPYTSHCGTQRAGKPGQGNRQYALALYQDDKFPGRMERILVAGEVLILCNG